MSDRMSLDPGLTLGGPPPQPGPDLTRRRILDAAEQCLVESGLTARIHGQIAERAGVSRPTVYKHVGDQSAIVDALVDRELTLFLAALKPVVGRGGPLREEFVDGVVFTVGYARSRPLVERLLRDQPRELAARLTVGGNHVIDRVVDATVPYLEPGEGQAGEGQADAERARAATVVEWAVRLCVSLLTTPGVAMPLDEPARIREFVNVLLDVGLT